MFTFVLKYQIAYRFWHKINKRVQNQIQTKVDDNDGFGQAQNKAHRQMKLYEI